MVYLLGPPDSIIYLKQKKVNKSPKINYKIDLVQESVVPTSHRKGINTLVLVNDIMYINNK